MPPGRSGYALDEPAIDPGGNSDLGSKDQPSAGPAQRQAAGRSLLPALISSGGSGKAGADTAPTPSPQEQPPTPALNELHRKVGNLRLGRPG
jgi:hypothetical protein